MGKGQVDPPPPQSEGAGDQTCGNNQNISDYTVCENGIVALEGDIGTAMDKLTENQNLVKFWELLYKKGVGTNNIEYMAENFELEKLNKKV